MTMENANAQGTFGLLGRAMDDGEKAFDPRRLSPCAAVRFPVRRLAQARVLWLNQRWFLEHGLNTRLPDIRKAVECELLDQYAVLAIPRGDPHSDDDPWLEADRYGGTGGAFHGGSGRCGMRGAYNAKGIGKTPLVSEKVDAGHRSGFLSLKEAVREAVAAEICHAELPWGAVPIVAIIDTGFTHRPDVAAPEERCAIVVRPNFIRPAHLERSIFFGDAGTPASQQFMDACRVRDTVRAIGRQPDVYPSVRETFTRLARQLGTARAWRLWQGRFLSSNLSMDGALIDFGAFRAVPSWRKCIGLAGECFGTEVKQLRIAFTSVLYYFAKYSEAGDLDFDFNLVYKELAAIEDAAFMTACLEGLGVPPDRFGPQPELQALLSAYYQRQQAIAEGDGADGAPSSIYTRLSQGRWSGAGAGSEQRLAERLLCELERLQSAGLPVSPTRTRAFFEPRRQLNYATSMAAATELEQQLTEAADHAALVDRFIEEQYSASIRKWPSLPVEFEVLEQATDIASAALVCRNLMTGELVLHVEGPVLDDALWALGRRLETEALEIIRSGKGGRRGCFRAVVRDRDAALAMLAAAGVDVERRMRRFAQGEDMTMEAAA